MFAPLEPKKFLNTFMRWTHGLRETFSGAVVAFDGKALRRAKEKGQCQVADKRNELSAVPELLRSRELAGCIGTLDAMGSQKQIAREIIEADADYVLALKGNQPAAHEEISAFLDVVFNEDRSRARHKHAGEKLSALRRWSLNLLKAEKLRAKRSHNGRRKCAGWDNACRLDLLGID